MALFRRLPLIISLVALVASAMADEKPIDANWWSLKPLVKPTVPSGVKHPIDAFIEVERQTRGLPRCPEADRRTLIRRLTFNLHGLPPTMAEVAAFISDTRPDAYERLVDRLLASPRYGERWARHWLDVVHYADSHGQDQDRPRPNAWPYRDYLIRAFNNDTPYPRFVEEQIAGDVLFADKPEYIAATGFLAAGPWDESGLMGIREDSLDRQIAHYLDRDDMVTTTFSTFAGATIHCARCHDHKFDPFTQRDYYQLQAVFAGIDKAERTYDADVTVHQKRQLLQRELELALSQSEAPPSSHAEAAALEAEWRRTEMQWSQPVLIEARTQHGTILKPLSDRSLLAVGKRPEKDTYSLTLGTELKNITALRLEALTDDTLPHQGPGRCDNGNLHLSEVRITAAPRNNPKEAQPLKITNASADFDQTGWGISAAIDGNPATAWGIYPQVGRSHQAIFTFDKLVSCGEGIVLIVELDQHHGGGHLLGRIRLSVTDQLSPQMSTPPTDSLLKLWQVDPAWRTEAQRTLLARLARKQHLETQLAALPVPQRVYCGTNHFPADGSFKPTTTPRDVHLLKRGEITKPGPLMAPGSLAVIPVPFPKLDNNHGEGDRRAALARWLTHRDNPLLWRTIVNRVWHYHFGKGLVDTPNDLGRMGGLPSHVKLLDWLATDFRDTGGSLKRLHKLILTSQTYRQSTRHDTAAALKDADNRYLWRMNRTRLDAESVRDAILLITGKLDDTMYGPPVHHFEMKPGIHVTPLADYDKFDVDSPASHRRSIYRYLFRTRPDPLLTTLDCPDASQSAPVRGSSVGALQALALWNNKFMLRYAEHLAACGTQTSPELAKQVECISEKVYQRLPTDEERMLWMTHAKQHGLANLCRVLLSSSEFLFVE